MLPDSVIMFRLLSFACSHHPDLSLDDNPSVLTMPNFNYQNIFITEDGRISYLADWNVIDAGTLPDDKLATLTRCG